MWLTLYELRLIAWDPPAASAEVIFLVVLAFYSLSALVWFDRYRLWHRRKDSDTFSKARGTLAPPAFRWALALLHVVGLVGIASYVRTFAAAVGGLPRFVEVLMLASAMIRRQSEVTSSFGTQLSYFGWIAIGLTWFEYCRGRLGKPWLALAVLQLAANLLYIDRTRPFTILFTSALLGLLAVPLGQVRNIAWRALALCIALGAVFLLIASWIGKVAVEGQYQASALPLWAQNLYYYGTGGFAYFSRLVGADETIRYLPERALYPALKALSALGLVGPPPSQLNEYYYVPFPTNVGTFLEPFYQDGGFSFTFVAIVIHSFGLDALGLALLRSGRGLAVFGWANLCFVTFISFFTPKLTGFPTWLFTSLAIAAALWPDGQGRTGTMRDVAPLQDDR
jgi:hypothetical protein